MGLTDVALIYNALGKLGTNPLQADEMELWQVASMLGMGFEPPSRHNRGPRPARRGRHTYEPGQEQQTAPVYGDRRDLAHERIRHSRGEGPPPEAQPTDPGLVEFMQAQLLNPGG